MSTCIPCRIYEDSCLQFHLNLVFFLQKFKLSINFSILFTNKYLWIPLQIMGCHSNRRLQRRRPNQNSFSCQNAHIRYFGYSAEYLLGWISSTFNLEKLFDWNFGKNTKIKYFHHQVETTARVNIRGQHTPAPIPLLFIIIAILIGLLLFILLTLLLWKLGFFKRRRPDPTLSGNLEKHRLDDWYIDYIKVPTSK